MNALNALSTTLQELQKDTKTFCFPTQSVDNSLLEVAVVSSHPSFTDFQNRKILSGTEGSFVKNLMQQANIPLSAAYFTAVIKDIDNQADAYYKEPKRSNQSVEWTNNGNRQADVLRKELLELPCTLYIAVGNLALAALTGRWGIDNWRGSLIPCIFNPNAWVMPILPPERIFAGASEERHLILMDLKKAVRLRNNGYALTKRTILTKPTFNDVMAFLEAAYHVGMQGTPIAFDIEIKYLELNCISFAWESSTAMSIPFLWEKGDYWTAQQEASIMLAIAKILTSSSIKKLGQNLVFDTHFLLRKYGIRSVNLDDTMLAQHALMPQFPKGLDMIASLWTDIPYYKNEGKEWFRSGGAYETLWRYNGLDSLVCVDAFPKLINDLRVLGNMEAYERQVATIQPCVYMMEHGIYVDMAGLRAEREAMVKEVEGKQRRLNEIAPGLNPNSPKQLQEFFYIKHSFPMYKNKKGKVTTDVLAMKRIARQRGKQGSEVAQLILDIRKLTKLISTYMVDVKFDSDDRIRCSYNPGGTTFSRLSSSKSIFGTGMNMQNWPHRSLRHLKPDPGFVYYGIDLSQAENRIVAYLAEDKLQIHCFENWIDLHRITAGMIFNKEPEEISDEPGSSTLGSGEQSERDWGKRCNHGFNYGFGPRAFGLMYELEEPEAKRCFNAYHGKYPGIRKCFHTLVQNQLRRGGVVTNLMGRKTLFLSQLDNRTEQKGYACIPQGTVGDIINERGMAFLYYLEANSPVELLQQVHDSIGFQIPLSLPWFEHARIIWNLKRELEQHVTAPSGVTFSIPADVVMGRSLHKETGIEFKAKKFPKGIEELAEALEEGWNKLMENGDGY